MAQSEEPPFRLRPRTIAIGFGLAGAAVMRRLVQRLEEDAPHQLLDLFPAALLSTGWLIGGSALKAMNPPDEAAVIAAAIDDTRRGWYDQQQGSVDALARQFRQALSGDLAPDRARDESRRRAGYTLQPNAARLFVCWSGGDAFGSALGPAMVAAIQRELRGLNITALTCLLFDVGLAESLEDVPAGWATLAGAAGDLEQLLCFQDAGDGRSAEIDQCVLVERSSSYDRLTLQQALDTSAEVLTHFIESLPAGDPGELTLLNAGMNPPYGTLPDGTREALVTVAGVHTEAVPAAMLERYAALSLARALTDEWLADAPLAEIAPPDMLDAEVLRPRDEQWAADAHHALEAYREELGGLTRLAPDSIELAVAGLAARSMNEVVALVEQRLDSKRTALRESFGAALEVAVRGALGAPAGPLSSAERLVAAWREMLHAKRPVPRRDPVLPSVQTPMSVLSGVVRGLPYPQAALLWAVIAAVLLLYYTIYSPAVPRWWGGDYVSLILGTVLGILVIGALTVVWLRTGRRHVPAAARIVLDASDARTMAHLSRVRDVLAQRALDDLERILARFDGEASPFAAARARLRRLRDDLDQDLMQIALDDGLPRSWLVAAADLAAFWRSNRPDLREESRNFLAGERLGRAVLDGSDGIWWAFREDLLAYCLRWSAQAVAPVSVFRVLRSIKDARRRAIEAFAEYGRPRCSVTPDVNALRLYLVTPDPADPMSQEVARGVKRATDAVAEVATLPAAAPSVLAVLQVMPGQMFSRLPRIEQARRAWQSLDGDLRNGAWQRDGSPWDSWCGNTLLKEPGR